MYQFWELNPNKLKYNHSHTGISLMQLFNSDAQPSQNFNCKFSVTLKIISGYFFQIKLF